MKKFRTFRLMLMALFLCIVPASSFAGVFVSVNFGPPVLPVYVQPPCPEPGWMWVPGYWAYGPDGYYWVPGTWVPAPYEGALWTPGYWGWGEGLYIWHPGYWGRHVGYYGGVNYGFGYMGIGFVGGMWFGHEFRYNTAVVRVNETVIHNTYNDRTVVERNTIVNDRHVAYSGGPGGINHQPAPEERLANRDQHVAASSFQMQHENSAMQDRNSFAKVNGGHPANVAVERPLTTGQPGSAGLSQGNKSNVDKWDSRQIAPQNQNGGNQGGRSANPNGTARPAYNENRNQGTNPLYENGRTTAPPSSTRGPGGFSSGTQVHGNAQAAPPPAPRPTPQAQPQSRPAPPPRQEQRSAPPPRQDSRGRGK